MVNFVWIMSTHGNLATLSVTLMLWALCWLAVGCDSGGENLVRLGVCAWTSAWMVCQGITHAWLVAFVAVGLVITFMVLQPRGTLSGPGGDSGVTLSGVAMVLCGVTWCVHAVTPGIVAGISGWPVVWGMPSLPCACILWVSASSCVILASLVESQAACGMQAHLYTGVSHMQTFDLFQRLGSENCRR